MAGLLVPPMPLNATTCGGAPVLSYTARLAVMLPVVLGVNCTYTLELAPAARVKKREPIMENWASVTWTFVTLMLVGPVLEMVTGTAPLVVLTAWLWKLSEVGLTEMPGAVAVP